MAEAVHSQAPHHIPGFLPGSDGSDPLFTFVVIFMIVIILLIGNLYFTLHALPEKIAHRTNSTQFQLIAVLALLAMFTHNNLFWIAALLLATVKLPDLSTPLNSISSTLEELRDRGWPGHRSTESPNEVERKPDTPDAGAHSAEIGEAPAVAPLDPEATRG